MTIKNSKRKYTLDPDEQELLEAIESGQVQSLESSVEEIKKLKRSAKAYGTKVHRINIRLTDWDYEKTQEKALREGIPYTTLIASIVHKFFTGQLVERNKI
jgi:predicted DNA binding CopG/RHH family protein